MRILALALCLAGCEAQLALGSHTPQRALAARTHVLPVGGVRPVNGVPVRAQIDRAPFGLRLRGQLTVGGAPPRPVAEGDRIRIGDGWLRVLAVRAWLRDGRLVGGEIHLLREAPPARRSPPQGLQAPGRGAASGSP